MDAIRYMLDTNLISSVHDCSKGGIIISLLEVSIQSNLGFTVDIEKIPSTCKRSDYTLFSETHNRFIISTINSTKVQDILMKEKIPFADLGVLQLKKIV